MRFYRYLVVVIVAVVLCIGGQLPVGAVGVSKSSTPPIIVEPQAGMKPIYQFMRSAKSSLDMTMYELSDPTAENILASLVKDHVRVRVLLDHDYHGGSVNQAAYAWLQQHHVPVRWSYVNAIYHQKTITVNGDASLIMTLNLTAQYYRTSRDLAVLDTNPQDVKAIVKVFDQDWNGAAPTPNNPTGSGDLVWSPDSASELINLIESAHHTIDIESEEMSYAPVVRALMDQSRAGVKIRIVMTQNSEWDYAFTQLARAGVQIHLYPNNTNGLYIHAKFIDVDGAQAFVGSENFSYASIGDTAGNRELGIITSQKIVVDVVTDTFNSDFSKAPIIYRAVSRHPVSSPRAGSPKGTAPQKLSDEGHPYKMGEYCPHTDYGDTLSYPGQPAMMCQTNGKDQWVWSPIS